LLNVGVAKFFLGAMPNGSNSYVGFLDEFHIWNRALSPADVTKVMASSVEGHDPGLLVDYRFDESVDVTIGEAVNTIGEAVNDRTGHGWNGRLGSLFASLNVAQTNPLADPLPMLGPTGRPDRVVVTNSPVAHLTRYISPAEPNGVPKVAPVAPPSDPTSAITSVKWAKAGESIDLAPYYHFMVGVDAPQTAGHFDPSRMVAIHIDGVDFFERAGGKGPTRWELRSSLDGFSTVIVSGQTAPGQDYQHHVERFASSVQFAQSFLHPTQPIEFRLYGLDAAGGSWAIDDFALIAGLVSPAKFDLPPKTQPQLVTTVSGNATLPFNPTAGATDPNGDPIAISAGPAATSAGVLTRNAAGQYLFTPEAGTTGNVPLSFTIMDRWGLTTTATVTVNDTTTSTDTVDAVRR
jgi:hypothetical protein